MVTLRGGLFLMREVTLYSAISITGPAGQTAHFSFVLVFDAGSFTFYMVTLPSKHFTPPTHFFAYADLWPSGVQGYLADKKMHSPRTLQ